VLRSKKPQDNNQNFVFWGLKTFKIIDVGTPRKLISSACYDDEQHVRRVNSNDFLEGALLFDV